MKSRFDHLNLPKTVREPLSLSEFRERAEATPGRCILLMRHAERPKIKEDDPTFGENLGLTEHGIKTAIACGNTIRGLQDCAFGASPMRRTRETAKHIAIGMQFPQHPVVDIPEAGIPGLWVVDQKLAHRCHEKEGAAAFTDRYLHVGEAEGYRPVAEGARLMTEWLITSDFGARCAVITSHDIFIACLLQGLGVRSFDSASWLGYLQAAALIQDARGSWEAFYCVPDKNNFHNTFIQ